jgi:indolepyruvate ferredoxin oxidoreductase beta subunit
MSQRGGSVVTYVRFGDKVYSPVIEDGEADFIISFEKLEAARYVDKLKKDGTVIVNTQQIDPMPVIIGAADYPEDVLEQMEQKGVHVDAIDALSLAVEAGSSKACNIVLMGRLAKYFEMDKDKWEAAIRNSVKPQFIEMNIKAFELGYNN